MVRFFTKLKTVDAFYDLKIPGFPRSLPNADLCRSLPIIAGQLRGIDRQWWVLGGISDRRRDIDR